MRRRLGCLNLHGSLLPRWRGAAPIQRAVMAGDARTGVMVMQMDEGLDTGPVALVDEMPIGPDMTAGELHDRMMLRRRRPHGPRAGGARARQPRASRRSPKRASPTPRRSTRPRPRIDWSRPAAEVHNIIRGLSPFPGAWFELELGGSRRASRRCARRWPKAAASPGHDPRRPSDHRLRRQARCACFRCSAKARAQWMQRLSCAARVSCRRASVAPRRDRSSNRSSTSSPCIRRASPINSWLAK